MFALILDSLGSTELLFILAVALIFFGPRKLPQLARSVGKSVAEFRRASEDFKRTWEREVALETARLDSTENSILDSNEQLDAAQSAEATQPWVEAVTPENSVARESQPAPIEPMPEATTADTAAPAEPLRKQDWL